MTDRPAATSVLPASGDAGRGAGSTSVDTDVPTVRLPGISPVPPTAPGRAQARRIRRVVVRLLLGALALFVGLVLLGAVLQATGAVPPAPSGPTGPPATAVPSAPAAVPPPPVAAPVPAPPPVVAPPAAAAQPATSAPARQAAPLAPRVTRPPAPAAAPVPAPAPRPKATAPAADPAPSGTYYANCSAARAAGVAPLHSGDPGYRAALDRDSDGVACE